MIKLYTAEEFAELPTGGMPCELVRGVVEVREGPEHPHAYTAAQITHAIMNYLDTNPIGVLLLPANYRTERGPDTVRVPDISFVTYERLNPESRLFFEGSPDLAIEVLSPSNSSREMVQKMHEYFATGSRMVWLADPQRRTVAIHALEATPYMIGGHEILDGGDVLPGFRAPINKFFGWPPRDPRLSPE